MYEDVEKELRELLREAMHLKESGKELEETLFEDVWIENEEDYRRLFDDEIPSTLKEILERIGLSCRIFHKKDDVPGYEYLANCMTRTGRRIALGFDVDYDEVSGEVMLLFASAWRDSEWTPNQLVYYHET